MFQIFVDEEIKIGSVSYRVLVVHQRQQRVVDVLHLTTSNGTARIASIYIHNANSPCLLKAYRIIIG
jgi:hypothetical protein